jgi:hypothetical protein
MSTINTGPTATTLHHLLAFLQEVTGADPLLLLWGLFLVGAVVATGALLLGEAYLSRRRGSQKPPRRSGYPQR